MPSKLARQRLNLQGSDVIGVFMALLSFRGISTPSLQAQGEQRRSSYFNIHRDIADFFPP